MPNNLTSFNNENTLLFCFRVTKDYSGYSFNHGVIYKDFIEEIYKQRVNANNPIMNRLYGRYAAIYEEIQELEENDLLTEDDDILQITSVTKLTYNNVPIASAITSMARRMYVFKKIKQYLSHILYWDTDGIFLDKALIPVNKDSNNSLGQFRLVSNNKETYFIATKFYYYYAKEKKEFKYTLGGIEVENNLLAPKHMAQELINCLNKTISKKDNKYTYRIVLKNRIITNIEYKDLTFYNKRKLKKDKDSYITEPWTIRK